MKMYRTFWLLTAPAALLAGLAVAVPALAQGATPRPSTDGAIVIQRANFAPEGIEYNPRSGHFLVSSIAEGTVYDVNDDGRVTPFVKDRDLKSSIGIRVDAARNRLLVTNTDPYVFVDPNIKGSVMLGIYDLTTGRRQHMVNLGALYPNSRHFAEDVAVDADGNAYVTDAFSPVIYKVDKRGRASLLVEDSRLSGGTSGVIGLNGIAYHPHGYLVVAVDGTDALIKVPLADPKALSAVSLSSPISGDGMVFDKYGRLFAVNARDTYSVALLTSDDDWASAAVKASVPAVPPTRKITTLALREGEVHVLYSNFDQVAPIGTYQIVPVDLGGCRAGPPASGRPEANRGRGDGCRRPGQSGSPTQRVRGSSA